MTSPSPRPTPALHLIVSIGTIGLLFLLLSPLRIRGPGAAVVNPEDRTEIGVEHPSSVMLTVVMTEGRRPGIVDITHDSAQTIAVSVPAAWSRREVRNVAINDVSSEPSEFGFTRYRLPPTAEISFSMEEEPKSLIVHSNSSGTLSIKYQKVNLETGTTDQDVVLVKDGKITLW